MSQLTFAKALNQALVESMKKDSAVIAFGLGVDDPKRIFGTTNGLLEEFGEERVFDTPTAENGMTGVAIGAAINGLRPVMVHQRLDFFLLAMDQLVNAAAKWHFMFGGKRSIPITIRLIVGRGWGQGPTHSQSLQSWFAHIPGLKVVMPSNPSDAKNLLASSIFDDNPVIFLEHRWLHQQLGNVSDKISLEPIGKASIVREGKDITIVSYSHMTIEAKIAASFLSDQGISSEIVDLRSLNPIDWSTVLSSVKKTGRLIALDTASETLSIASEIIAKSSLEVFANLKTAPMRIALPDIPVPTSFGLTKEFYPTAETIAKGIGKQLSRSIDFNNFPKSKKLHDVPGDWFNGPF